MDCIFVSTMVSKIIIGNPTVIQQLYNKEDTNGLHYWLFVRGIHQWLVHSFHKGAVIWKYQQASLNIGI